MLYSLTRAASAVAPAALHGRVVARLVWQSIQSVRASADLARMAASSDLFLRVTDRYEKPQWHLEDVEIEVAQEKPFCRLIHFKQGAPKAKKVLVVARFQGTTPPCCATRCARCFPSTTCGSPTGSTRGWCRCPRAVPSRRLRRLCARLDHISFTAAACHLGCQPTVPCSRRWR